MNDSQKLAIGGGLAAAIVGGVLWSRGGTILGPVGMVTTITGVIISVGGAVSAFTPKGSRRAGAAENSRHLCRSSSKVQSLIFPRSEYTVTEAKAWARRNGFTAKKAHITENTIRIRQTSPKGYRRMRTKALPGTDVKAVVGWKNC